MRHIIFLTLTIAIVLCTTGCPTKNTFAGSSNKNTEIYVSKGSVVSIEKVNNAYSVVKQSKYGPYKKVTLKRHLDPKDGWKILGKANNAYMVSIKSNIEEGCDYTALTVKNGNEIITSDGDNYPMIALDIENGGVIPNIPRVTTGDSCGSLWTLHKKKQ